MHHSRKKSGHGLPNTSLTDVRKAVTATDPSKYKRPAMTRRQTPQKLGRSQREREREWSESWEDERESFPQFCMTCEKQFIPHDDMGLYCSDSCRRIDQTSTSQPASSVRNYAVTLAAQLDASKLSANHARHRLRRLPTHFGHLSTPVPQCPPSEPSVADGQLQQPVAL
ncbi:hypothetical protein G7Z17_g5453 [Cylindrodendrum hubeiense]|uniref:Uncharacterized protein n=1 Tax=Cylindrodendrum hubeiense TaxID=595255 RepID=A0A9P5HCV8_9HYPO|nr:hypothetical protein G7Z17_g5453 [Cylindrodendrum hubeiense]